MSYKIPSSGQVSIADLVQATGQSYSNISWANNDIMRVITQSNTDTQISLSNLYSKDDSYSAANTLSYSRWAVVSALLSTDVLVNTSPTAVSTSDSTTLNISNYFGGNKLQAGDGIEIQTGFWGSWTDAGRVVRSWFFNYGSSYTFNYISSEDNTYKTHYYRTSYDGANTITFNHFYNGQSTNYPYGRGGFLRIKYYSNSLAVTSNFIVASSTDNSLQTFINSYD